MAILKTPLTKVAGEITGEIFSKTELKSVDLDAIGRKIDIPLEFSFILKNGERNLYVVCFYGSKAVEAFQQLLNNNWRSNVKINGELIEGLWLEEVNAPFNTIIGSKLTLL